MNTEHVEDLIDLEALGGLSPEESTFVRAHVADCPECRAEMERAEDTAAMIALSVPLHHAPAGMRARVMAEVQPAAKPIPIEQHRRSFLTTFTQRWGAVAAALVAFPLVGLLTWNMILQKQVNDLKDDNRQVQESQRDVVLLSVPTAIRAKLQPTEFAAGAKGGVSWNPDEGRCAVAVNNLWKQDGVSYHVYYQGMKGIVDAGELKPDDRGNADLVFDASKWRGDEYQVWVGAIKPDATEFTPLLQANLRRE